MSAGEDLTVPTPNGPRLELDELIDQLVERAEGVRRAHGRLRALLRAIESVTGDLALEQVLRRIAHAARRLADAEYAALGVIGPHGELEQFIHVGIDIPTAEEIGQLPQGKGLLGALIVDPRPIRLRRISDDPRSVGFPSHHPPMTSFLGVPIRVRGEVFGNLYLTNSAKGEFSTDDEELMIALAGAAGTAISNARLYEEAQLQQRWLRASGDIQAQLISSSGEDPLQSIARRAMEIADADLANVCLLAADRESFVIEFACGVGADELIGRRFELASTISGRVIASGESFMAVDGASLPVPPAPQQVKAMDTGPIIIVPVRGAADAHGVVAVARNRGRRPFSHVELEMMAGFATQASVAIELAEARSAEQKMIIMQDRERIARDLHDHVIQQLFAVGLSLEGAIGQLPQDAEVTGRLTGLVGDLDSAIRRIRSSIFTLRDAPGSVRRGLRQSVLDVVTSVTPMLGRAPSVSFSGLVDLTPDEALAEDVVACVRELLTNVAKHAHAGTVTVDVEVTGGWLSVTICDDGDGLPDEPYRSGLANLDARAAHHGGALTLAHRPTGGTIATWTARTD
ncbi:GAF domain-containing protein [Microlunatus elymi]|uniref:GAF domain-containing protein n=1 Tax=Microlunatus elymi TaxID=2596828 RepID=A0A516Q0T3_9ACTN|nr:GAF domain-containing protein [Microlunatus elymi]QDP97045.1 GAF domain-containing protein [Microlunatus elymi]